MTGGDAFIVRSSDSQNGFVLVVYYISMLMSSKVAIDGLWHAHC